MRAIFFTTLLTFFAFTYNSWAVHILIPKTGSMINKKTVHLIFTDTVGDIKVLTYKGGRASFLTKEKSKEDLFYYHYLLELEEGVNVFYVGDARLELTYKRVRVQQVYKFHGKTKGKECASCHGSLAEEKNCMGCHKFPSRDGMYIHGPIVRRGCFDCHRRDYGVLYTPDAELCKRCHYELVVWSDMPYQHGPFGAGSCVTCHDPHESSYKFLLRYEPKVKTCLVCHKQKEKKFKTFGYKFHPILTAVGCTVCHDPHASNYPKQLFQKPYTLCTSCHPKLKNMKRGHPIMAHPTVGPKIPGTNKRLTCSSCHDPHGSIYDDLLYASKAGNRICLICHKYQ